MFLCIEYIKGGEPSGSSFSPNALKSLAKAPRVTVQSAGEEDMYFTGTSKCAFENPTPLHTEIL